MARYGGFRRSPAVLPVEDVSMVSEHQSAAATTAHGGDLEEFIRSRVWNGSGFQWSSDLRSGGGDGCCFFKNQEFEHQLDGIGDQRSFLEDPGSSIFSLKNQQSFLEEAEFKNQQAGCRSHGNHWRGAAMQVDDGKIVGRQLFDEMPKRQVSNHNFSAKSSSLRLHDRQVFDEIPKRSQPHWDEEARMHATRDLLKCVIDHRIAVKSRPSCVRGAVIDECNRVEQWLRVRSQQQDAAPTNVEPLLWSHEIRRKIKALDTTCRRIIKVWMEDDVDDSEDEDEAVFFETSPTAVTEVAHHCGAKQDKLIAVSPTEQTVILSNTELPNNPPTPRCVSTTPISFKCLHGCELGEPKPPILECLYCWKEDNCGVGKSEGVEGLVCHAGGITQGRSEESALCPFGLSVKKKNALVFDIGGAIHDMPFCNSLSQCQTRVSGTTLVDDELESFGVEVKGSRCALGQIGAHVLIAMNEPAEEKDVCELINISGSSFHVLFPVQFFDGLQTGNPKSKQTRKYNFLAFALGIKELSSYSNRKKFNNTPKYSKTMREVVELELRKLLIADGEGVQTFDPGGGVAIIEAQIDSIVAYHIMRTYANITVSKKLTIPVKKQLGFELIEISYDLEDKVDFKRGALMQSKPSQPLQCQFPSCYQAEESEGKKRGSQCRY